MHSSDTCEKQGQCPRSSGRTWRHSVNAGGEACRRERQGTHPPRRLHAFGRSHPNPTLTTACLLHNAARAGPMFEGEHLLVISAGITRKVRARLARARVPAACACLLPCVSSSGCCACPRLPSARIHLLARPRRSRIQPSRAAQPTRVLMISLSFSLSAAARSQCIGKSGGKAQALSSCCSRCASSHAGVDPAAGRQEGAQPARARPVGAVRERCAGEPRPGRQHQARTHARHQGRHISRRSPEPFPNMRNSRNGEKGRYKGL